MQANDTTLFCSSPLWKCETQVDTNKKKKEQERERTIMPTALQEMLFDCYLIFTCTHITYCCTYLSSERGVFYPEGKEAYIAELKEIR
jgi:hypothetical protein